MIAYGNETTITKVQLNFEQNVRVSSSDLEVVYYNKYNDLVRLARVLVDDTTTASDVVQEAFVKALTTKPTFHSTDAFSYMKTAVMNQARSTLRKRAVSRKHLSSVQIESDSPIASPTADELPIDAKTIANALASLPRRQRECIALAHTQSMTHKEIAIELGISVGSVKQHISRGIEKLNKALKDER